MSINICVLGEKAYYERILPNNPYLDLPTTVFLGRAATNDQIVAAMPDAEVLLADAIAVVDADLIDRLPQLKLINSEGVAFNHFDCAAAAERGVFVCNNRGMNAGAVAEQTVLLMLGLLRGVVAGDAAVREGRQMEVKMRGMREGITDLADCTVGLVGLGAIAQATATRLGAFGCRVLYTGRSRKDAALEERLGVTYAPRDELLASCDFVSVHCAVTPETRHMVNDAFLAAMRPGSFLINTARGELVDNDALVRALVSGHLGGAGLDTVAPEPVTTDNPLLNLPAEVGARVLFSPHVGGITTGSMRRGQAHMWDNVARVERGERPTEIVNGL
jgi:phosphoglycerate dehydrogenase-like enzyme